MSDFLLQTDKDTGAFAGFSAVLVGCAEPCAQFLVEPLVVVAGEFHVEGCPVVAVHTARRRLLVAVRVPVAALGGVVAILVALT